MKSESNPAEPAKGDPQISQRWHGIRRIVSGGQTGADRGALDTAIKLGIPHGGWCPRGRRAEDGVIPAQYQLSETPTRDYHVRTEQNVVESEGTLVFYRAVLQGGTELTRRMAVKHGRPHYLVNLAQPWEPEGVREWIRVEQLAVLNVAGPRESTAPGIAWEVRRFLENVLVERPPEEPSPRVRKK
jgi:hypothetical protein